MSFAVNESSTKRHQKHKNAGFHKKRNPKRGGPGIMMTCETGRERKCQQEGLHILNYYALERMTNGTEEKCSSTNDLSLEDEIKKLKGAQNSRMESFCVYDIGVRGMITFLCTMPNCNVVIPYTREDNAQVMDTPDVCINSNKEPAAKKPKLENEKFNDDKASPDPSWDPIDTVGLIIKDLREGTTDAPSSRFVTRMIPIQVSCTANKEEIEYVARELFSKYNDGTAATFAIRPKRRLCTSFKSDELITMIANLAPKKWKVKLVDPKYTFIIELCKNFCGLS
eukprot:CAMPEP_0178898302 /NCGR_PEP_ID=MMETSP0786-20121207/2254_1 /TAXON_ID=186022 /ORGANISM="Thalassionema frauenfeldii, Strain CCMP 1798" /LENGTH=281 /DNA_ID=CAMNT_0020569003 /DNA_START=29 /DNA_END=871 /DNA_ORIENTATION=-